MRLWGMPIGCSDCGADAIRLLRAFFGSNGFSQSAAFGRTTVLYVRLTAAGPCRNFACFPSQRGIVYHKDAELSMWHYYTAKDIMDNRKTRPFYRAGSITCGI